MKKFFFCFIACALATPAALPSADFEGSVYFKINTGKGSPQDINYSAKNGLVRIDIKKTEGRSPSVILDAAKQEMIILLPEQKKYMVQAIAESRNPLSRPGSAEPTLEKIDGTEKIIGYDCGLYVVKSKDSTTQLWLTEQLGAFVGFGTGTGSKSSAPTSSPSPMSPPAPGGARGRASASNPNSWESLVAGKNLFPLRVITINTEGQETSRLEATGVEKKSLSDSDFAPPAGWEKFDMGSMMRSMLPPPPPFPGPPK
jgi:hypothetical protein